MIGAMLCDGLIAEAQGDYRLGDASILVEDAATGMMPTTLALTGTGLAMVGRDSAGTAPAIALVFDPGL